MIIKKILASLFLEFMMIATPVFAAGHLVDVNSATVEQLEAVNGIGEKIAAEIVGYREEHGSFKTMDELLNVKGIAEKRLEKIKSAVEIGGKPSHNH